MDVVCGLGGRQRRQNKTPREQGFVGKRWKTKTKESSLFLLVYHVCITHASPGIELPHIAAQRLIYHGHIPTNHLPSRYFLTHVKLA